ncbi:hypothetical protein ZIOFF_025670 [Zingiber officinale]|uniref:Uncharacterized protein n=1 Tax=Zingiber officinale TaxID=94328 RepID=A0A8J5H2X8_ZINOF|nr:hypothetical protein ZIOFF_075702 [Zingiber officinale]KAG6515278.1 hypothetical protein ZIOFF_025670 [Zingiber officinale]
MRVGCIDSPSPIRFFICCISRINVDFLFVQGSDSLDDCVNHLICPCCTLSQESRTLEMNNVQNGVWHGRGDTICLVSSGEGSNAFPGISKPPLHCSMERVSAGSQHSWNTDTNQSEQLVPPDQFGQNG